MGITFITRDFGINVSIVRITTTDAFDVVAGTGYILNQYANIVAANEGPFTWQASDEVLVNANGINGFFQISADFNSLIPTVNPLAVQLGLTALAGGGQTGATQLNSGINVFTVVATAGDSALLPAVVLGQTVVVVNTTATSMNVFPATGDTINALSANAAFAVAGGATTVFYGVTTTNWRTK